MGPRRQVISEIARGVRFCDQASSRPIGYWGGRMGARSLFGERRIDPKRPDTSTATYVQGRLQVIGIGAAEGMRRCRFRQLQAP